MRDRRPPHYRCPAVPGLRTARPGDPDGAWLLRSFLWINHLPNGNCVLLVLRTAGGLSQRHFGSQLCRPSCICFGLEPHCRTSRCVRPQPTPSPRYCSLTSLRGTANCTCYGYCSRRPLITAGHPVRSPVPSPSCNQPGFETPSPHRPAHCNCGYCGPAARQFVSAGPFDLFGLREKP